MILGLDVSTSCTGLAILDLKGKLISNESINISKTKNIYEKSQLIFEILMKLQEKFEISEVYIEEALMNFKFGRTSAHTLSLLHKFNGMVSLMAFQLFSVEPEHINASTARKVNNIKKYLGKKTSHTKSTSASKIDVFEHLVSNEPLFTWEETRNGTIKSEAYDRADAIMIAKAGFKLGRAKT